MQNNNLNCRHAPEFNKWTLLLKQTKQFFAKCNWSVERQWHDQLFDESTLNAENTNLRRDSNPAHFPAMLVRASSCSCRVPTISSQSTDPPKSIVSMSCASCFFSNTFSNCMDCLFGAVKLSVLGRTEISSEHKSFENWQRTCDKNIWYQFKWLRLNAMVRIAPQSFWHLFFWGNLRFRSRKAISAAHRASNIFLSVRLRLDILCHKRMRRKNGRNNQLLPLLRSR